VKLYWTLGALGLPHDHGIWVGGFKLVYNLWNNTGKII